MSETLKSMIDYLEHAPSKVTLEKSDQRMIAIWLNELKDLKERLAGNFPPSNPADWKK